MLRILMIGDIVGQPALSAFCESLPDLKLKYRSDAVIVNAENAHFGKGVSDTQIKQLTAAGVDMITSGNHIWSHQTRQYVNSYSNVLLRPLNYGEQNPGKGVGYIDVKGYPVAVINLIGRAFMPDPVESPFEVIETELKTVRIKTKIILVDFHGETTAEKQAMGHFLDGRVSTVVGTHTHVQTADERILPKGTAYISDLGMSGPYDSVIGMNTQTSLNRFLTGIPHHYQLADGPTTICGVSVEIDEDTGEAKSIERIQHQPEAST